MVPTNSGCGNGSNQFGMWEWLQPIRGVGIAPASSGVGMCTVWCNPQGETREMETRVHCASDVLFSTLDLTVHVGRNLCGTPLWNHNLTCEQGWQSWQGEQSRQGGQARQVRRATQARLAKHRPPRLRHLPPPHHKPVSHVGFVPKGRRWHAVHRPMYQVRHVHSPLQVATGGRGKPGNAKKTPGKAPQRQGAVHIFLRLTRRT
eukprot:gene15060-biopygen14234